MKNIILYKSNIKINLEKIIEIDLSKCKNDNDLFNVFKNALEFPNWFGENWSAFHDCILNLTIDIPETLVIKVYGFQNIFCISEESSKYLLEDLITLANGEATKNNGENLNAVIYLYEIDEICEKLIEEQNCEYKINIEEQKFTCPICGFNSLLFEPNNSHEICPCCGYEFGTFEYNREDLGKWFPDNIETSNVYNFIRELWLGQGANWYSETIKKPDNWDLINQLNNIKGYIFKQNIKSGGYSEFQYCNKNLPIKELLDYKNIENWKEHSLYIEESTHTSKLFWDYYLPLLKNAYIDDNKIGFNDYGDNYYTKEQTLDIYNKIKENNNLPDREVILEWLKTAIEKYNGIYFLGA